MKQMRTLADAQTEEEIIAFVKAAWPDESLRPNPLNHYGAWAAWTRQKMWDRAIQVYGEGLSVYNFMNCLWRPVVNALGSARDVDDKAVMAHFECLLEALPGATEYRHYEHPLMEQHTYLRLKGGSTAWGTTYTNYVFGVDAPASSDDPAFMQSLDQTLDEAGRKALYSAGATRFNPAVYIQFVWHRFDTYEYRKPVSRDRKQVIAVSRKPFPNVSVPPPLRPVPPEQIKDAGDLEQWFPRCKECGQPLDDDQECKPCRERVENLPKTQLSLFDSLTE